MLTSASAAIPASERAVLVNLYSGTGGTAWTNNAGRSNVATGVNGAPGAECSWAGVGCDVGGTHVTAIVLQNNDLVSHSAGGGRRGRGSAAGQRGHLPDVGAVRHGGGLIE